jgi:hypothetical protein
MQRRQQLIEANQGCVDAGCDYISSLEQEVVMLGAFDGNGVTLQERRRVDACIISRTCIGMLPDDNGVWTCSVSLVQSGAITA